MKTAFATFLLWVSAIALLGGIALLCAIAEEAMFGRPHFAPTPAAFVDTCGKVRPDLLDPRPGEPLFPIKRRGSTA